MRFEWAVYAAEDQGNHVGHQWRAGSLPEGLCPHELRDFTDLPAFAEGQHRWTPYFSAQPLGEWYVWTYTSPNPSPGRSGRVVSRVLLVDRNEMHQVEDMQPIFEALRSPTHFVGNHPLDLDVTGEVPVTSPEVGLVLGSFTQARGKQVVHASPDEPGLLRQLWGVLPPTMRADFSFRRHFSPQELTDGHLHPQLILVPSTVHFERGEKQVFCSTQIGDMSAVVHALLGNRNPRAEAMLSAFQGGITGLGKVHSLIAAFARVDAEPCLSALQNAVTLLCHVPLEEAFREEHLARFTHMITSRIPQVRAEDLEVISGLRYYTGDLQRAVVSWVDTKLFGDPQGRDLLETAIEMQNWFSSSVQQGLHETKPSVQKAKVLLNWLESHEIQKFSLFHLSPVWDQHLFETHQSGLLLPFEASVAAKQGWWRIHAVLQATAGGLKSVLDDTPKEALSASLKALSECMPADELFLALIERQDERTVDFTATLLQQHPNLMANLDVQHPFYLQVWAAAVSSGMFVFQGVSQPQELTWAVLNEHSNTRSIPGLLLEAIAKTPQANLLSHPERAIMWSALPTGFLFTSARAYLHSVKDPGTMDPLLLDEVLRQFTDVPSEAAALRLSDVHARLNSQQMGWLLLGLPNTREGKIAAARLPQLRKPDVVGWLVGLFSRGKRPVPEIYDDFLSAKDQLRVQKARSGKVDHDTWWRAAQDILPGVVGSGPDFYFLQAGGSEEHLYEKGSHQEKWLRVLQDIRGGQKPRILHLLLEVSKKRDHPDLDLLVSTCPLD